MSMDFRKRWRFLMCAALAAGTAFASAEMRTWTDVKGRKVQAELLEVDMTRGVRVRLANGREVWIAMEKLAGRDRIFARTEFARKLRADQLRDPFAPNERQTRPEKAKPAARPVEPNFSDPWPSVIDSDISPDLKFIEPEEGDDYYVCESAHYRVRTSARLSKSLSKRLMILLESTHRYCAQVPLNFTKPRQQQPEKFPVRLFASEKDYRMAGGLMGAKASYNARNGEVLITLEALGVKEIGNGYTSDASGRDQELVALFVRQLADPAWTKVSWLDRGLASFMRITPYRPGKFTPSSMKRPVERFFVHPVAEVEDQEYLLDPDYQKSDMEKLLEDAEMEDTIVEKPYEPGFGLGTKVVSPPLARLMAFSELEFDADLLGEGKRSAVHYGVATLLVHYMLNGDGESGKKAFQQYLRALQKGKAHAEVAPLLYGKRTPEQFQKDFQRYWTRAGIDISFEQPGA
ncbi:hypothetical protein [Sulfuriroseicoccus oceanibius]|uniref:SLA1 homology domain-containing protein n=1 Tax=Sulfuriroseicoccus oceanibius TaxID=2707525 RepID=A0A6B3LAB8_9BACT|nr:hypothetical protein [Sulfuriroseicoccus oceanibius]QQL46197.1 hypothetical protein G3M56_006345 [Sulfuriroseicoccus oceanibius]